MPCKLRGGSGCHGQKVPRLKENIYPGHGDEASNIKELEGLGYEIVKLDEKVEPKVVRP